MGSSSIFKKAVVAAICVTMVVTALQCNFAPNQPVEFVQQPVSPVNYSFLVDQAVGSQIHGTPTLAFNFLLYYQDPIAVKSVPIASVEPMPNFIPALTEDQILTPDYLNRGFALGYGNYVLGVAQFIVYDDLNKNGAMDAGEPVIACAPDYILVYFQGALTQGLIDEFGNLQQGYNLCYSIYKVAGVDKFEVVSPDQNTVNIHIQKDTSAIYFPRVR